MTVEEIYHKIQEYESLHIKPCRYLIISSYNKYELIDQFHSKHLSIGNKFNMMFCGKQIFFTENLKKDQIIIAQ